MPAARAVAGNSGAEITPVRPDRLEMPLPMRKGRLIIKNGVRKNSRPEGAPSDERRRPHRESLVYAVIAVTVARIVVPGDDRARSTSRRLEPTAQTQTAEHAPPIPCWSACRRSVVESSCRALGSDRLEILFPLSRSDLAKDSCPGAGSKG